MNSATPQLRNSPTGWMIAIAFLALTLITASAQDISGTVVASKITTGSTNNPFAIGDTAEMSGTPKQVATIAARNLIPALRRTEGMECWVTAGNAWWRLQGGIDNTNWTLLATNGVIVSATSADTATLAGGGNGNFNGIWTGPGYNMIRTDDGSGRFSSITNTGLTASALTGTDANKAETSITLGANLALVGGVLSAAGSGGANTNVIIAPVNQTIGVQTNFAGSSYSLQVLSVPNNTSNDIVALALSQVQSRTNSELKFSTKISDGSGNTNNITSTNVSVAHFNGGADGLTNADPAILFGATSGNINLGQPNPAYLQINTNAGGTFILNAASDFVSGTPGKLTASSTNFVVLKAPTVLVSQGYFSVSNAGVATRIDSNSITANVGTFQNVTATNLQSSTNPIAVGSISVTNPADSTHTTMTSSNVTAANFIGNASSASRLVGEVSLLDFGAVGNGSTDCVLALSNAFRFSTNIYVPPGRYLLSTNVWSKNDKTVLRGVIGQSVFVAGAGLTEHMILMTNLATVTDGLTFDSGSSDDQHGGASLSQSGFGTYSNQSGLWVNGTANAKVLNCQFVNWPGHGLTVTGATDIAVRLNSYLVADCTATNNYMPYFFAGNNASQYGTFRNCSAVRSWFALVTRSANIVVDSPMFHDGQFGWWHDVDGTGGFGHLDFGNGEVNHFTYGFFITNCLTGVNIHGNNFLGNGECDLRNSDRSIVLGNLFETINGVVDAGPYTNSWMVNTFTVNSLSYSNGAIAWTNGFLGFSHANWLLNYQHGIGFIYPPQWVPIPYAGSFTGNFTSTAGTNLFGKIKMEPPANWASATYPELTMQVTNTALVILPNSDDAQKFSIILGAKHSWAAGTTKSLGIGVNSDGTGIDFTAYSAAGTDNTAQRFTWNNNAFGGGVKSMILGIDGVLTVNGGGVTNIPNTSFSAGVTGSGSVALSNAPTINNATFIGATAFSSLSVGAFSSTSIAGLGTGLTNAAGNPYVDKTITNLMGTAAYTAATDYVKTNDARVPTFNAAGLTNFFASYDSPTNTWAANTAFGLGTNGFLASGAATLGITGLANQSASAERYGQLTIKATGDIIFTNHSLIKTSDMLASRTITNGNFAVISVDYIPGQVTNLAIVQFR